jgi:Recombination endonuclease VII
VKRCPDCLQYKPLTEFPRNRRTKSGYATYCKPCHNARGNESRQRLYGSSRHYHLTRRYGIGAPEFDALVREQDGVCPICDKPDPEHVDHDHVSGRVRGILCFNCNGGLGQFGDDPERLVRAQLYLEWSDLTPGERTELAKLARQRTRALREVAV